ncbi:hypothetical protein [Shewanella algae]|uniref:hypothetical protein n=1 Tax=Shewanella algae TaxID=38313 RepID=UPI001AADAAD6|nr:hypothetical protein [Shewanella algae]MBO2569370.1 hypothetical protein [Shewanella algae]
MAKKGNKSKKAVIATRANEAYVALKNNRYQARASRLIDIEPGFALLLLWCEVEQMLKLIRYSDKIKDGWPDKLNFIRSSWGPLKRIKGIDAVAYEIVLGAQDNSLWKQRNVIAHSGQQMTKEKALQYWSCVEKVNSLLRDELPCREDLITKKMRSDAQTAHGNKNV